MVLKVFFSLLLLLCSISYAQTTLNTQACVLELKEQELSPGTPESIASFDLPNSLKIPLIDLTRLRIELTRRSDQAYLSDHYLNELQKLKEVFLLQGYAEEFFDETRAFFFHELSQRDEMLEQVSKVKTSLAQKQKDAIFNYPLKGRSPQVVNAIIQILKLPVEEITFEDLASIKQLSLSVKSIETLTENDFLGLINLEFLNLSQNRLKTLPEKIFQGLPSLKWLYLNENFLNKLPDKIFAGLHSLTHLSIANIQLTTLPENIFSDLSSLEALDLHENKLKTLPEKLFQNLSTIKYITLSRNPLKQISPSLFSALPSYTEILLLNVPLNFKSKMDLIQQYGYRIMGVHLTLNEEMIAVFYKLFRFLF